MIKFSIYDSNQKPQKKEPIIDFLYTHLEQYGDSKLAISTCIDFALKEYESFGGNIIIANKDNEIAGIVVINKTGMKYYIPENILVYIAVNKKFRRQGIGKLLMEKAIEITDGDIALHVEPDNPAKFLYQNIGFKNKYIEMRYTKSK